MSKTAGELDLDITRALAGEGPRTLHGHTSEATAYLVADYPYGFRERTQIRYWLEHKPKKGWRFVSQTLNPKTQGWNKPKASTYTEWGAAMYLDDQGHVQWEGIGPYTNDQKVLEFVKAFPGASMSELRKVVPIKLRYLRDRISGRVYMTINNVQQPVSEADIERLVDEQLIWEEIGRLVGPTG